MSFHFGHIPIYTKYFLTQIRYKKWNKGFRKHNMRFGSISGGVGEQYFYDIEDEVIP